jgi:outer membrane protein assembly factor BamB
MEDNTIVTPLPIGDRLVTSDWDVGMVALELRRRGEIWEARPAWKHREVSLSMSSPVLANGLIVGFSHLQRGQLFVLDPDDGKVLWRGEPRSGEHASLISWDDRVLVAQEDGTLLLAEVSREGLQPIRRYRLGHSVAWSHPAVAGGRIVFRDGTRLAVSRFAR